MIDECAQNIICKYAKNAGKSACDAIWLHETRISVRISKNVARYRAIILTLENVVNSKRPLLRCFKSNSAGKWQARLAIKISRERRTLTKIDELREATKKEKSSYSAKSNIKRWFPCPNPLWRRWTETWQLNFVLRSRDYPKFYFGRSVIASLVNPRALLVWQSVKIRPNPLVLSQFAPVAVKSSEPPLLGNLMGSGWWK